MSYRVDYKLQPQLVDSRIAYAILHDKDPLIAGHETKYWTSLVFQGPPAENSIYFTIGNTQPLSWSGADIEVSVPFLGLNGNGALSYHGRDAVNAFWGINESQFSVSLTEKDDVFDISNYAVGNSFDPFMYLIDAESGSDVLDVSALGKQTDFSFTVSF